jgi:hypothetical protein
MGSAVGADGRGADPGRLAPATRVATGGDAVVEDLALRRGVQARRNGASRSVITARALPAVPTVEGMPWGAAA